MKNSYATDTMALILRLEHRRLGGDGKSIFEKAENGKASLWIPAMAMAELCYLSEKKRIETNLSQLRAYMQKHDSIKTAPVSEQVVETAFQIRDIPELHDRIIAATAIVHNSILITNDPTIAASVHLKTIW
jgi:predicted nucleic acid-binding protein